MGVAVAALAISTALLVILDRQKNEELARLKNQQAVEADLTLEIESLRQKESYLQNAIDNERDASGDLADELDRERQRRGELERELQRIGNGVVGTQPAAPIIASLLLMPSGGRGGASTPEVKIGPSTKRVSMRVSLPEEVTPDDRLTVQLNQKVAARDLSPRISGGSRTVNLTVPTRQLITGKNQLDVFDADGKTVSNYGFNVVNR